MMCIESDMIWKNQQVHAKKSPKKFQVSNIKVFQNMRVLRIISTTHPYPIYQQQQPTHNDHFLNLPVNHQPITTIVFESTK